jgi:GH25 family lysozyme M1 (1,4-beta-N-acetylmuramidase)
MNKSHRKIAPRFTSALALCLSLGHNCTSFAQSASAADLSRTMIDLSVHNPDNTNIKSDWKDTYGIELVFFRSTIGVGSVDDSFEKQFPKIREAGLYAGAYHLLWSTHTPEQQASGFISELKKVCSPGQHILLAADWEPILFFKGKPPVDLVSEDFLKRFIIAVKNETGKPVLVYTDIDMLTRHKKEIEDVVKQSPLWLSTDHTTFWEKRDGLASDGDVVVQVKGSKGRKEIAVSGKDLYVIPKVEDVAPWNDWMFWQFGEGSSHGTFADRTSLPSKGAIDLSYFNGGREDFRKFFTNDAWTCPGANQITQR